MGLLGVLHLAGVLARAVRDKLLAIQLGGLRAGGIDAGGGQRRGVRTHISDVAVFVQALRDTHRALRGEAQLPAGLLLQRGGHERRVRAAGVWLFLHVCDVQFLALNSGRQLLRALLVQDQRGAGLAGLEGGVVLKVAALRDALAAHGGELGLEGCRITVQPGGGVDRELGGQVPVVGGAEGHALALALDDHAGGDGLHTPCGQARHDLLPQHRGDLVAVKAVEHAAGLLGVHEVVVQLAGVFHGLEDRGLGDLVENHAADRDLGLQNLQQVPGDGLALAVGVCCEQQLVDLLELGAQVSDALLLIRGDHVEGLEALIHVHAEARPRLLLILRRNVRSTAWDVTNMPN